MVITDRFVYLHIPKSGGTFVEEVLGRLLSDGPDLYVDTSTPGHRGQFGNPDQHERFSQVPVEHRDKALLLTVRNPYDHHVSLYEFGWWKHHPRDTFEPELIKAAFPHFPELSFEEYLVASLDWGLVDPQYAPPVGYGPLIEQQVGPLTFDFIRFLAPDPDAIFARLGSFMAERGILTELPPATLVPTHRLNQGLQEFLLGCGYAPSRLEFIPSVGRIVPDGTTRTASMAWPGYYTAETRQLVRHRERALFDLFPEFDAEFVS